jgi:hypothetical protein
MMNHGFHLENVMTPLQLGKLVVMMNHGFHLEKGANVAPFAWSADSTSASFSAHSLLQDVF